MKVMSGGGSRRWLLLPFLHGPWFGSRRSCQRRRRWQASPISPLLPRRVGLWPWARRIRTSAAVADLRSEELQRASAKSIPQAQRRPQVTFEGPVLCLTTLDCGASLIVRQKSQEQSRSFVGPFWSLLSATQWHRRWTF
jgi:hypothetical protein